MAEALNNPRCYQTKKPDKTTFHDEKGWSFKNVFDSKIKFFTKNRKVIILHQFSKMEYSVFLGMIFIFIIRTRLNFDSLLLMLNQFDKLKYSGSISLTNQIFFEMRLFFKFEDCYI